MGGKRVTIENVFEIEPYRSVINLLNEFQSHKEGIEQRHMRYALIKNHDKDNLWSSTQLELESFFGDRLQQLVNEGYIKPDCITSRNRLTNVLDTLLKMGIVQKGTLKRSRKKKFKYFLHPYYRAEIERRINKDILDDYPIGFVTNITQGKMTNRIHLFYGISPDIIDTWDSVDKEKLVSNIEEISDNISKIEAINNKYKLSEFVKLIRKASSEFEGSKEFTKAFSDNGFLRIFCYMFLFKCGNYRSYSISLYDIIGTKDISDKEIEKYHTKLNTYFSDFEVNFYNSLLFEEWNLDIDEMMEFDIITMAMLNSLESIREISYSCYHKYGIVLTNKVSKCDPNRDNTEEK